MVDATTVLLEDVIRLQAELSKEREARERLEEALRGIKSYTDHVLVLNTSEADAVLRSISRSISEALSATGSGDDKEGEAR